MEIISHDRVVKEGNPRRNVHGRKLWGKWSNLFGSNYRAISASTAVVKLHKNVLVKVTKNVQMKWFLNVIINLLLTSFKMCGFNYERKQLAVSIKLTAQCIVIIAVLIFVWLP